MERKLAVASAKLIFIALSAVSALFVAGIEEEAGNPDPLTSSQVADLLQR